MISLGFQCSSNRIPEKIQKKMERKNFLKAQENFSEYRMSCSIEKSPPSAQHNGKKNSQWHSVKFLNTNNTSTIKKMIIKASTGG